MSWRYLFYAFIITLTWLLQTGFISAMPTPFNHLNLSLVILLILLLFDDLNLLYFWTILSSLLLSLGSRLPLAVILISWWLVVVICYSILYQFLTNRSLYSLLLLVFGGTIFLESFILVGLHIHKLFTGIILFQPLNQEYFASLAYSVILNAAAMLTLFYFMNGINSKLKPFLLLKRKS